jgi:hypothetical protein
VRPSSPCAAEQRHAGLQREIFLQKRKEVSVAAKCRKTERWNSRKTRNWALIKEVWLNQPWEHLGTPEKVEIEFKKVDDFVEKQRTAGLLF